MTRTEIEEFQQGLKAIHDAGDRINALLLEAQGFLKQADTILLTLHQYLEAIEGTDGRAEEDKG